VNKTNKKFIIFGSVFLIAGIIYLIISFYFQNVLVSQNLAWADIILSTLSILYGVFEDNIIHWSQSKFLK